MNAHLARNYALWYRTQTIRYPNWLGPINWKRTVRLQDSILLEVDFCEAIGMNLILDSVHEAEITERLLRTLRTGDVFVDVGANLGYYTLIASNAVGDSGLVLAFEPSPANVAVLAKHVSQNDCDNVLMFSEALSDRGGIAKLSLPWYFNSGVCSLGIGPSADGSFRSGFTLTSLRTLDQVFATLQITRPVRLIKIDAEGHEPQVLRGMEQLLRSCPDLQIVCELSPDSYSVAEFLRYMSDIGFQAECHESGKWHPTSPASPPSRLCNAWFTKR